MRYAVIIESAPGGCSAYVPDLPGCIAAGSTVEETERLVQEAIEFHLEGMRLHGEAIPAPTTYCSYVTVPADPAA